MEKILLFGDVHYWGSPSALSDDEARLLYQPTMAKHLPRGLLNAILRGAHRRTTERLERLALRAREHHYTGVITLGDECHGIGDRGIESDSGFRMMLGFRRHLTAICEPTGKRPLFHVPSEHMLGYWRGTDYFPSLGFRNGKFGFHWSERHRDIGGGLSDKALERWLSFFGHLWGVRNVEGLTLVWMANDLERWHERFQIEGNTAMLALWEAQRQFLRDTLSSCEEKSVILFTHRPDAAWQSTAVFENRNKLRAVVFGDFHTQGRLRARLPSFSGAGHDWWFVPALWGLSLGIGQAGYATLVIHKSHARFHTYNLNTPFDV